MGKKILMVDGNGKEGFPNLALLKLSSHHKDQGDKVDVTEELYDEDGNYSMKVFDGYDKAYLSYVFDVHSSYVEKVADQLPITDVEVGGYGYDETQLPDHIDNRMPDYNLYPQDFSMGFTSRGCIRNCPFCDVPQREGDFRESNSIDQFLHPNHDKVLILDNNFLASNRWKEKLKYINEKSLKVSLTQGIDARLVDEEGAKILADTKMYDWRFKNQNYYTAWDLMEEEERVLRGIRRMIDAGVTPRYIRPYVLVGYNTSLEDDLYRFNRLRELGTYPFVMPLNNMDHPLKRWGQRPALFKTHTFEEYVREKLMD